MKENLSYENKDKTKLSLENLERMADVLFEILLEQLGLEQKNQLNELVDLD